jgi:staphylococcal nuclease domain-containing protein 1
MQPFAWQSREFLRRRLVGKEVEFTVDYKVPSGREFATITVGTFRCCVVWVAV